MQNRRFRIVMFVHKKWAMTLFAFQKYNDILELELEDTNIFFNLTILVVQLMNGDVTWRGAHEKYPISMQILLETF